jgi:NAD(P)-dependent dehydrogenase (short-subunit alcohol dehydrogenase family)
MKLGDRAAPVGGRSGIGWATAVRFGPDGALVAVVARAALFVASDAAVVTGRALELDRGRCR